MVGDAKDPRLEARRVFQPGQVEERIGQRLLDDVYSVERRTAHPRAETMEPRTQVAGAGDELLP
jgi:hypothetical protein